VQRELSSYRKAALITGAARRIGKHIAIAMASLGYDVVIHYNTAHNSAEELKVLIETSYGVRAELFSQDFIQDEDYTKLIKFSLEKFPYLNMLVNNASIFLPDNLFNSTQELFDNHYKIHIKTPFFLIQNLINISNSEKELKIINVIDAFIEKKTAEKYFSYLLSKKALYILTEMIREYICLNNLNVKIYSLLPSKIY
jgi:NAD(P)-dependent dehydrogenase (short-subunit alcohol dehydrogenase family)